MSAPLTLAVVVDAVQPWHVGGAETRYASLLPRLTSRGVHPTVFTMRWWGSGDSCHALGLDHEAICDVHPLYGQERRGIGQAIAFARAALKVRRAGSFQAIEADQAPYLHLFALRYVAWRQRIPMIVTWHEYWGWRYWRSYGGVVFGTLGALIERLALATADHVISVSQLTTVRLRAAGVSDSRMTTLYAGAPVTEVLAVAPAATRFDVLFAGRLISHKRADLVISAIALLRDSGREANLGIIGAGPESARLQALVHQLEVDDLVTFLGPLEHVEDVWSYMKSARVFAYPSEREGYGLAVSEALICGIPVVTSDHADNAASDLVVHGLDGYVVPAGDAQATASAIHSLLTESPKHDVSSAFLSRSRQRTWDELADEYVDLVRTLCL